MPVVAPPRSSAISRPELSLGGPARQVRPKFVPCRVLGVVRPGRRIGRLGAERRIEGARFDCDLERNAAVHEVEVSSRDGETAYPQFAGRGIGRVREDPILAFVRQLLQMEFSVGQRNARNEDVPVEKVA